MLTLTQSAIDAIKTIAPGDAGLRLYLPGDTVNVESLQLEVAAEPRPKDQVLEADGANVFLEPEAAVALDDMVLDAAREGGSVRFAIGQRP